jgi:hypothetical protein
LGQHIHQVYPSDRHKEVFGIFADILAGKTEKLSIPLVTKDGTQIPVDTNVTQGYWGNQKAFFFLNRDITMRKQAEDEREKLIQELQVALIEIKTLSGLLPICSYCKKIRDDKGYWNIIESYVQKHSNAQFTHSICPECAKKHYPDLDIFED